jgi:hypothetical protein
MEVTGALAVADSKLTANTTVFVYELLINLFFPFSLPFVLCQFGRIAALNRSFLPPPCGDSTAIVQTAIAVLLWVPIVLKALFHFAPAMTGLSPDDPSSVLQSISSPLMLMVLLLHLLRCLTIATKYSFFSPTAYSQINSVLLDKEAIRRTLLLGGWTNPVQDSGWLFSDLERASERYADDMDLLQVRLESAQDRAELLWACRGSLEVFVRRSGHRLSPRVIGLLTPIVRAMNDDSPPGIVSPLAAIAESDESKDTEGGEWGLEMTSIRHVSSRSIGQSPSSSRSVINPVALSQPVRVPPVASPTRKGFCSSNKDDPRRWKANKEVATPAVAAAVAHAADLLSPTDIPARLIAWHLTRVAMKPVVPGWALYSALAAAVLYAIAPSIVRVARGLAPLGDVWSDQLFLVSAALFAVFNMFVSVGYLIVGAVDSLRRRRLMIATANACNARAKRVWDVPRWMNDQVAKVEGSSPKDSTGMVDSSAKAAAALTLGITVATQSTGLEELASTVIASSSVRQRRRESLQRVAHMPARRLAKRLVREASRIRIPMYAPDNAYALMHAHRCANAVGRNFNLRIQAFTIFFVAYVVCLFIYLVISAAFRAETASTNLSSVSTENLVVVSQVTIALVTCISALFFQVWYGASANLENLRVVANLSNIAALTDSATSGFFRAINELESAAPLSVPIQLAVDSPARRSAVAGSLGSFQARLMLTSQAASAVARAENAKIQVDPQLIAGITASYALVNSVGSIALSGLVAALGAVKII